MKLQKFKERNNKQKSIMIFTIACILLITGVFLYKTFASFQVVENEDLINGNVSDPGDIYFVFYKDNQITKEMPKKGTGYAYDYEKSHCEVPGKEETKNKAIPYFDSIDWSVTVKGMSERPTKCTLYFYKGYQDENLHGTDPVLERPLIPVHIDETGKVTKADPSQKWYDYEKKEWANAVILVDETKQYEIDQEIEEKDIESYFVWIPKYRYQLFDLGNYTGSLDIVSNKAQKINIQFGNYDTQDAVNGECTTPMMSGSIGNCHIGDYMTHPAFLSIPSTGFWVGKFETGYNQNNNINEQIIDTSNWTKENAEHNHIDSSKIIIKPNVYSWREMQLGNMFYTSYNYQRNLDSHMTKSTEWGAIMYLSLSQYGINKGITKNANCDYKTGYSFLEQSQDIPFYNTSSGYLASSTGNITGVYDLSGGSWEYSMAVMKLNNGEKISGLSEKSNSNFVGNLTESSNQKKYWLKEDGGLEWPNQKYYDLYQEVQDFYNFQIRILGDATGELGPFGVSLSEDWYLISSWYSTISNPVNINSPWLDRGSGDCSRDNFSFLTFAADTGRAVDNVSFRIILTTQMKS